MSLQPTPLEWLLLRIINELPARANDYDLERFFAKTDVCLSFYSDLRDLVKKNWLSVHDQNAQVRQYSLTEEGRQLLDAYSTLSVKHYVLSIEPTGFILSLLEKMDSNT